MNPIISMDPRVGTIGRALEPGEPYQPGVSVERHTSMDGYVRRTKVTEALSRKINAAAKLYADVLNGREDSIFIREAMSPSRDIFVEYLAQKYPALYGDPGGRQLGLRETMSRTDYKALFLDVLDRQYYGYYKAFPFYNRPLVRVHPLRDFRTVRRYMNDSMVTPLTAVDPAAPPHQRALTGPVPQGGATLATADTAGIDYTPLLYHSMASVNWAAFVNDDLGIFKDLSMRLAMAAIRGQTKFVTSKFFDANGPHASLYTSGYGNIINTSNGASSTNPALSSQGLMDGIKILSGMRDAGGDPIMIGNDLFLVYGPGNEAVVQNLINASGFVTGVEGGTVDGTSKFPQIALQVNNWIKARVTPIMDPYIPIVASNRTGSWILVANQAGLNRPTVEMGFLNGFEDPQMFRKLPNTQRLGGGVEESMGDFFTGDQDIKVVTVFGAGQMDGRGTVGSNGSGS